VDKPAGWTSHDVVNKIRRITGEHSVGHLGTLDPLATGVLPLLLGRATRLAKFYGSSDKVYEATIRFGFATTTYDTEGDATTEAVSVSLDPEQLELALTQFRGGIEQVPPAFSAKKIRGVAAYKLARRDQVVELAPVRVEIHGLELLRVSGDTAELRVHCSSGTYIRSLAHDLGGVLGCGAHLVDLRRTRSGEFQTAHTIEKLETDFASVMIPAAGLLPSFPMVEVDDTAAAQIRHGRDFRTNPFRALDAKYVKAVSESGELIAIGQAVLPNLYHPVVVL
jgi:tRNA pseudouridine55 synthase